MTVCAWCNRFLGPETAPLTHGICAACSERQRWKDSPVLVVAPHRQALIPVLRQLLQGSPEVRIVLDRRRGPRRQVKATAEGVDRRRGGDRRRGSDLSLV
ncbi:MAG TPA: hypothetical protein VMR21_06470 [Vicinamibacteria bacterium]|nr:hypothetical protein [Vicinamibacteria bacterium]